MKYFILVIIAALAIAAPSFLTDEENARLKKYSDACKNESLVDSEVLNQVRTGTIADDAKLKKHLFCVQKKIGSQNEDGTINIATWNSILSVHVISQADALIKHCAVNKGSGEETAYESTKCLTAAFYRH